MKWFLIAILLPLAWIVFRWTVGSYVKKAATRVVKVGVVRYRKKKGMSLPRDPRIECRSCGDLFQLSEASSHDCADTVIHERLEKPKRRS